MPSMIDVQLKKLAFLALLASLVGSASALTVSVAPAEGAAYAAPPDGTLSPLGYFMSGCLDVLYDSGYVVTDAPPSRVSRKSWGSSSYALDEAKEGLVDYVIAVYVDWRPSIFHRTALLPVSVTYRLVRVLDGKVVGEGEVEDSVDSEESSTGFAKTASLAGASAARACMKLLSTLVMGGE
jgi:hypothetical protein